MGAWNGWDTAAACVVAGLAAPACLFGGNTAGNGQATLGQETEKGSSGASPTTSSGTDDLTGTTSGEGSSETEQSPSQGDPDACQSICTAPAPAGWDGPRYFASAPPAAPTPCPVGYEEAAVGFRGLDAPPADCNCSCKPTGGGCTMDYDFFTLENCTIPLGPSGSVPPNQCASLAISEALSGYVQAHIDPQAGTCESESSSTVSPPAWEAAHTVCAPPALTGDCGGDVCVPAAPEGFEQGLCITADGDVACPEGPYAERTVMYQGLLDDRTCSDCSCEVSSPPSCDGVLALYAESNCTGTPQTFPADDNCYDADVTGTFGLSFAAVTGDTTCASSGSVPLGEASRTNALTVCCAP